ncbi:MAG: hypothetical protein J4G10_07540 [Alphaproteobacteria bacterium]|nr:hypothetical protein [Alphaproteobacteria bacterium]
MKSLLASLFAVCVLLAAVPASATQADPRLDELFERLKTTEDPVEAENLQEHIWQLWIETENEAIMNLFARAREVMLRDDYGTALDLASEIVQIDPNHAEGWNLRATIFYAIGDYESSIQDVEKTLQLEPRHFGALVGLGMMYVDMGEDMEALHAFERALAVNPHLTQASRQIEVLKQRLGGAI